MRHSIILLTLLALTLPAHANDSTKTPARSFSLPVGIAFDNYGYLDNSRNPVSTEYAGIRLTTDWIFAPHWGLKLDITSAWAFLSNSSGQWEKPMHSITNISLAISPYYQFNLNRWFFDLGIQASSRARLPFMNGEMSRYLMTLSVALGANFRFGYMFTPRLGIYADIRADRTLYDILYNAYYNNPYTTSGALTTSLGIILRLHQY